jgi:hypothetical protein
MRIGHVVNGSGSSFATRSRIEKNDPAAMNSAKHILHRWRARRGPPRRTPNRMMRTSPIAASVMTVATKNCMKNGTPERTRPGRLKVTAPATNETSANPNANPSAATLMRRVHGDAGRTVVSAVATK